MPFRSLRSPSRMPRKLQRWLRPSTRKTAFARADAPPFAVESVGRPLKVGVPNSPLSFFEDSEVPAPLSSHDRPACRSRRRDHALRLSRRFATRRRCSMTVRGWPSDCLRSTISRTNDLSSRRGSTSFAAARPSRPLATFECLYRLAELRRAADAEWKRMDVMLLPTAGTTYKIADMLADPVRLNSNLGAYTNFVNLLDLAALAVPAGFRERRHAVRRHAHRAGVLRRQARHDRRRGPPRA